MILKIFPEILTLPNPNLDLNSSNFPSRFILANKSAKAFDVFLPNLTLYLNPDFGSSQTNSVESARCAPKPL